MSKCRKNGTKSAISTRPGDWSSTRRQRKIAYGVEKKRAIYPIHPGTVLADELAELGISVSALARTLRVPYSRVYRLVSGRSAMTADTALRFQEWLGVSTDFWMNLQKRYELDLAIEAVDAEIKHTVERREPSDMALVQEIGIVPLKFEHKASMEAC
jgi:antitoxin HigA-1